MPAFPLLTGLINVIMHGWEIILLSSSCSGRRRVARRIALGCVYLGGCLVAHFRMRKWFR